MHTTSLLGKTYKNLTPFSVFSMHVSYVIPTPSHSAHPTLLCLSDERSAPCSYLLGDLEPGFLQTEDGTAVEGGGDLQHRIVVVQAPADVRHCHPLLDGTHPCIDLLVPEDLRRYQVTDLWGDTSPSPHIRWTLYNSYTPSSLTAFFKEISLHCSSPSRSNCTWRCSNCNRSLRHVTSKEHRWGQINLVHPSPWLMPGAGWLHCLIFACLPVPHCGCTYIIKVFCVLHDVRSPFVLLKLHPTLPKELSANDSIQVNIYFPFFGDAQALQTPLHPDGIEKLGPLPPTLLDRDHTDALASVMDLGGSPWECQQISHRVTPQIWA